MCKDVVLGHAITSRKDELDWNLMAAETMGNTFVLYNFANVRSYALARLKAGLIYRYRNPDPRSAGAWWNKTEAELLELIGPGGKYSNMIEPGTYNAITERTVGEGAWYRHVREHLIKRDGNNESAAAAAT